MATKQTKIIPLYLQEEKSLLKKDMEKKGFLAKDIALVFRESGTEILPKYLRDLRDEMMTNLNKFGFSFGDISLIFKVTRAFVYQRIKKI